MRDPSEIEYEIAELEFKYHSLEEMKKTSKDVEGISDSQKRLVGLIKECHEEVDYVNNELKKRSRRRILWIIFWILFFVNITRG